MRSSLGTKALIGGLLILGVLTGLAGKTRNVDPAEHERFSRAALALREWDSVLRADVYEARYGLLLHYDEFVRDINALEDAQRTLRRVPAFVSPLAAQRIRVLVETHVRLLADREVMVDDFKAAASRLRNSVDYLPALITELADRALKMPDGQRVAVALDRLLVDVLRFDLRGGEDLTVRIRQRVDRLMDMPDAPEGARTTLPTIRAHVRTILQAKPVIDGLLETLSIADGRQVADEINQTYAADYEVQLRTANTYRLLLYGVAVVLLVCLIGALVCLSLSALARNAANETLETRVRDRTEELSRANVDLVHEVGHRQTAEVDALAARELAERADRATGDFLATMSHEIRTPMNGVLGMTSLLLDSRLTSEQREFVEIIRTSGDTLLTVINDILDFSKIEAGKLELECRPFDLRACVEKVLDLSAAKASEKGLDLTYVIAPEVPTFLVSDSTRLRQILINLVANAVKFTAAGGVHVAIGAHLGEGELWEVEFAVSDTGVGIPGDRLGHLFQAFTQVDSSTTRKFGGAGLGLAICRRLATLLGGCIWADSSEGTGSTFHFTIQACGVMDDRCAYLHAVHPQLAGLSVLAVDDDVASRTTLAGQLVAWGMTVETVASGVEALRLLDRGTRFDLALLDMRMPGMDGLALAEEIRRRPNARGLRLLLMTALPNPELRTRKTARGRLAEAELVAVLSKPLKPAKLFHTLVEVVGGGRPKLESRPAERELDQELAKRIPLRILLAEDNPVNQRIGLRMLARLGYRADVARNGEQVVAAVSRQPYDLVLMGVSMPEVDGLEAARRIRERIPRPGGPTIVAMTARAMEGDREACLAAGMDGYLSKPVNARDLQALVEGCAGGTTTAPSAQNPWSAIDRERLGKLEELAAADDPGLMGELVDMFLASAATGLAAMRDALAGADPQALVQAAHALKGSAGTLGVVEMQRLCAELETQARAGQVAGGGTLLASLDGELPKAAAALRHYLSSRSAAVA